MTADFQIEFNRQRVLLRGRAGWASATDVALAAILGVSESCVTKWRRGERAPAVGMREGILEKLANFQPNQ